MPDTPKNPADDEAMKAALAQHPRHSPDATEAFEAGWRAAMAEVEKEQFFVNSTATSDKAPWGHSREGSEVEQAEHEKTVALIRRLHRALVLTRADVERHDGPYGTQARCVVAIREALRWLAKTDR